MKKIILILLVFPAVLFSQSEWNELFYHYQTGTVPPKYYFSYDITVASSGVLTLAYHPGYQTDSTWRYQFSVSEENIADLNNAIKESGVLTETVPELPENHRPIGGPLQHIMITLQQNPNIDQLPGRITTPEFPEEAYKEKLNMLYMQIRKLIPAGTWDEIEAKKDAKDR